MVRRPFKISLLKFNDNFARPLSHDANSGGCRIILHNKSIRRHGRGPQSSAHVEMACYNTVVQFIVFKRKHSKEKS